MRKKSKNTKNSANRKKVLSLTKDNFEWDYFRAGGKGGQAQNKRDTGVRCTHRPSGAIGEARDTASQLTNKRNAFLRCVKSKKFDLWLRMNACMLKPIDEVVDEMMQPENIKVEKKVNGKWIVVEDL